MTMEFQPVKKFNPDDREWHPEKYELHMALALWADSLVVKDDAGKLIMRTDRRNR